MIARTLGEADDDVQEFSVHARQEFLAMLRGDEEGELASERQVEAQARGALDKLETELAERRAAVEAERSALSQVGGEVGAADDDLTRKLRKLFAAWGGSPDNPSPLEREVIDLAVAELRRERAAGSAARLEEQASSIDLLERRISKLNHLLGETEAQLRRERNRASTDPGVASVYDVVQGIDEGDGQFEKKAELMASIFQASLAMREELAG